MISRSRALLGHKLHKGLLYSRNLVSGTSADCVEIGKHFRGNLEYRSLKILAKMLEGRCSRNQQDVGRALEKPGKRHLHRRGLK